MKKVIWFAGCVGVSSALFMGQGCGSQAVEFPGGLTGFAPAADGAAKGCGNGNDCTAPLGCVSSVCQACTQSIQCATGLVCKGGACGPDTVPVTDGGVVVDSGQSGCNSDAECDGGVATFDFRMFPELQ